MVRKHLAVIVAVCSIFAAGGLVAQTAELSGETLLRALLEELRTIRTSIQKTSAYELRGRLLIDRARMHQEVIRELSREVESFAEMDFMRGTETTDVDFVEPHMEDRVAGIQNPEERRKMLERHKQMMERQKEMQARHRDQMRLRHQRLENRLAEEREKLRVIEEELAQIQRELLAATR